MTGEIKILANSFASKDSSMKCRISMNDHGVIVDLIDLDADTVYTITANRDNPTIVSASLSEGIKGVMNGSDTPAV